MSPWLASTGFKKTDGIPVEVKEAAILEAMFPLFPTPEIINFPFKFSILFTALKKSSLRLFAKSFIALHFPFFGCSFDQTRHPS